ncbi:uncharacterized protein isoform X3 [Rhodnius prolixus]|uniref:uncharacterized protein isoform X3 n=1 Tax=Rhodnius prolixus TaxID=13249 RepID=UPI003D18BA23
MEVPESVTEDTSAIYDSLRATYTLSKHATIFHPTSFFWSSCRLESANAGPPAFLERLAFTFHSMPLLK